MIRKLDSDKNKGLYGNKYGLSQTFNKTGHLYLHQQKLIASCKVVTMVAFTLTWIYFHITRETYLVYKPQIQITASVVKVNIIL